MPKKRVLLVDDNAVVRMAVRRLFTSHACFEVCGEAEDGREAVEKAPSLRPDLIVLDLSMPVMSGLEAASLLIKILSNVWLILFTAHDGAEVQRLSRSGWDTLSGSEEQGCDPLDRTGGSPSGATSGLAGLAPPLWSYNCSVFVSLNRSVADGTQRSGIGG